MKCLFCSETVPDNASECANCGEALAPSSGQSEQSEPPVLVLTEMRTGREIEIAEGGIIGREGNIEPEFFAGYEYISRMHCEITSGGGEFSVEYLHTGKNGTKIGSRDLRKGMRMTLRHADILTLADTHFRVSIRSKAAEPEAESEKEARYIIVCRHCRTEYGVESADGRIAECSNCDDYNKTDIARIKAKAVYAD
jgi:hypothetical protein